MKKSTKIFVFGGLICMAVGMVIMLITGGIGGAKIVKDIVVTLKNVSITSEDLDIDVILPDDFEGVEFSHFAGKKELSISENGITSVNISVDGGEVNIQQGYDDSIVLVTESGFNTKYTVENGVLIVKEENDGFSNVGVIDVYLPDNVTFERITVSVVGGELRAEELNAGAVELNVGAGEITIENSNISKEAKLNVGVGEMKFGGNVSGNLELRCGMGELEFDARGTSYDDYNYNLRCAAGNIDLGDSSFSGLGMNKHIANGSDKTIDIDCGMGNVSIVF